MQGLTARGSRVHLTKSRHRLRSLLHSKIMVHETKNVFSGISKIHLKEILEAETEPRISAEILGETNGRKHTHEFAVWPKNVDRPSLDMELLK
jgi:hypothetical protein